jgi:hypothetical protein
MRTAQVAAARACAGDRWRTHQQMSPLRAGAGAQWLVFAATVATLLSACLTGRGTKAPARAPLQLRVTRQVEGEDEHGQQCGKVFVAANRALTQEHLDSLVVARQCPQLLFTDAALKAQFEAWRACSLPWPRSATATDNCQH